MGRGEPKDRTHWKNEADAPVPTVTDQKPVKPLPGQMGLFGNDSRSTAPEDETGTK